MRYSVKVLTELEIRMEVLRFLTGASSWYKKKILKEVENVYQSLLPIIKYRHEISCWRGFLKKGEIIICILSMSNSGRLIVDIKFSEEEDTQIKCRVRGDDDTLSEISKQINKLSDQ